MNTEIPLIEIYNKETRILTLEPQDQEIKFTVIFLHGFTGNPNQHKPMFTGDAAIPHCRVVLPTAPVRKLSVYGGEKNAWYDNLMKLGKIDNFDPEFRAE